MKAQDLKQDELPNAVGSYGNILESSALIGGSSAVTVVFGVIRTKLLAVLLGPSGVGLFGVYGSIISVVECLAGAGVNSSGVREIAQAASTGDPEQIGRTSRNMFRLILVLSIAGGAGLAALSRPVSRFTFGDTRHSKEVALLSLAVIFELLSGGNRALMQGMRRVRALAITSIATAALGLVVTLPLVYFSRERGIAPSIVVTGFAAFLIAFYFRNKIPIETGTFTRAQSFGETSELLKLGFVFMSSYLMTTGAGFLIRTLVLRKLGYEATGLYQAAWSLGGFYVSFILQSMGTDFYPRLTAAAADSGECNRLVNEQTEVGLLLAGPGVLAMFTLAPVILGVLYSSRFIGAVGILRWICCGSLLQVVTWPLSYILVAKGKQSLFFGAEAIWAVASLALAWFGTRWLGLAGVGVAFAGSYAVYGVVLLVFVDRLNSFRWSKANIEIGILQLGLLAIAFTCFHFLPYAWAISGGAIIAILSGLYSLRRILQLVSPRRIPGRLRRVLKQIGLLSREEGRAG